MSIYSIELINFMKISIVIPTYNEKKNIERLLQRINQALTQSQLQATIVIVDDNNPDGTASYAKKLNKKYPNMLVYNRTMDRGLATAILYGIKHSKSDVIIGMDADLNHPPELIPKLIVNLKKADIVIASRFIKGGGMEDRVRYWGTLIFNLFLKHILDFPVMDNLSGYYAIKRSTLLSLPSSQIYQGYGEYHLRLVYRAQQQGSKLKEIPVFYQKRQYGESKSSLFRLFFKYLFNALKLRLFNWD